MDWVLATLTLRIKPSPEPPTLYKYKGETIVVTRHIVTRDDGEVLDNYPFFDVVAAKGATGSFATLAVAQQLDQVAAGTLNQCTLYIVYCVTSRPPIIALYNYLRATSADLVRLQLCKA